MAALRLLPLGDWAGAYGERALLLFVSTLSTVSLAVELPGPADDPRGWWLAAASALAVAAGPLALVVAARCLPSAPLRRRPPRTLVRARRAQPGLRCGCCHDGEGALAECPGCGARLHPECWALLRRCPTLGCRRRLPEPAAEPGIMRSPSRAPWDA